MFRPITYHQVSSNSYAVRVLYNYCKSALSVCNNCTTIVYQSRCCGSIAATTPGLIVRILNSVFFKFLNYSVTLTRYRPTP